MNNFLHDIQWVVAIRHPWLTPIFLALSALGYMKGLMVILALGYWAWRKDAFARIAAIVAITGVLNAWIKQVVQDPRPASALRLDSTHLGYGFPSGHAQLAVVVWMLLAWEIRKPWAWVICSVLLVGEIFSRLYLGVHDIEDVLGGAGIGLTTLLLFQYLRTDRFAWWHGLRARFQMLALSAVMVVCVVLAPATARNAMILNGAFGLSWWAGVRVERRVVRMQMAALWWRRLLGAVAAAAGFVLLRLMLEAIFDGLRVPFIVTSMMQMIVAGAWMSVVAPWLLCAAQLATRGPPALETGRAN